jgi:16S rRNA (uracil1498-N3)-methyltransferase
MNMWRLLINFISNTPDHVNLFYQPGIPEGLLFLDQEESRHCVKVLRHKSGDSIHITDGKGYFYTGIIQTADQRQCEFSISEKVQEPARDFSIHIAISPTKNAERLEWFVEKVTEFGVDSITPIDCRHTERTFLKKERLVKVAISAMKQSLKAKLPVISDLTPFSNIVSDNKSDERFIAFVDQSNPDHLKDLATQKKSYLVLIGPEGDFSAEELKMSLDHGFRKVSLGQSRLRTETAGIAACHILNLVNV